MSETPTRVQLSRMKGWRMPENTVKVDRSTKWGNPYTVEDARECGYTGNDRQLASWCVSLFLSAIDADGDGYVKVPSRAEIREGLAGKNLGCWCKLGNPCHADVLLKIANDVWREH